MERSREIEQLVCEWFAAASKGDPSLIEGHVSSATGARLVGTDPDEWIGGGEAVTTYLGGEIHGAAGTVTYTPSDIEAHRHGDVGWAAARLTIDLPGDRRITPRWTAVLVREGDTWRFVQIHASIPATNEDVGWTYDEVDASQPV